MRKKIQIHIGGPRYGLHNIGDESILLSMLNSFKEYELSVSTYNSEWIKKDYPQINRKKIRLEYAKPKLGIFIDPKRQLFQNTRLLIEEMSFLRNKDLYLCGGGTILSDCPWYSLRTVQIAGFLGVPTVVWGVGMGEIEEDSTKKYINKVLNKKYVKRIYVRDQFVKERLLEIGVKPDKVGVSYDPAILLTGKPFDYNRYFNDTQNNILNNGHTNIVLSISGESDVIQKTPIEEIAIAINRLQKENNANIILIPTGCGAHCHDLELLEDISDELEAEQTVLVKSEFAPEHLISFLGTVSLIISSRLHMNIFGACAGVPSIGLVRNQKNIDFSILMKLPYLKLENLRGEELYNIAQSVLENRNKHTEDITTTVDSMREKYRNSLKNIERLIELDIQR